MPTSAECLAFTVADEHEEQLRKRRPQHNTKTAVHGNSGCQWRLQNPERLENNMQPATKPHSLSQATILAQECFVKDTESLDNVLHVFLGRQEGRSKMQSVGFLPKAAACNSQQVIGQELTQEKGWRKIWGQTRRIAGAGERAER